MTRYKPWEPRRAFWNPISLTTINATNTAENRVWRWTGLIFSQQDSRNRRIEWRIAKEIQ